MHTFFSRDVKLIKQVKLKAKTVKAFKCNKRFQLQRNASQFLQKYKAAQLFSTLIIIKKCLLSSKSVYENDF